MSILLILFFFYVILILCQIDNNRNNYCEGFSNDSKYIFGTIKSDGTRVYFDVTNPDYWEKPAYQNSKESYVENLNYDGGNRGSGSDSYGKASGILFKNSSNTIFSQSSNSNDDNSWGVDGQNSASNVYNNLDPPNEYYKKERKYLYRDQGGPVYVYAVFKKKTPSFSAEECCSDQNIDKYNCDVKYAYGSSDCTNKMKDYCKNSNLKNDKCSKKWCLEPGNKGYCENQLQSYCNDSNNLNDVFCRDWCVDNTGKCDTGSRNYCASHLDNNTYCSCYKDNSTYGLTEAQKKLPPYSNTQPQCYNPQCTNQGYFSNVMEKNKDCPDCVQSLSFDLTTDAVANFKNIQQKCYSDKIKDVTPNTIIPKVSTPLVSKKSIKKKTTPDSYFNLFIKSIESTFQWLFNN